MNAGKRTKPKRRRLFGRYTKQIIAGLFGILAAIITAIGGCAATRLQTNDGHCEVDDSLEIDFSSDSFSLSAGELRGIDDFHSQWPARDCVTVTLPGHEECAVEDLGISVAGRADERLPSELTNDELSFARARTVAQEFTQLGLPVIPELVLGLGAAEPPPPNSESESERDSRQARERRVDVKVICVS